jgi:hypothetical protein
MLNRILTGTLLAVLASSMALGQQRSAGDLKIVVIAGEGAVNIIQQKTAVAPIIEVRDRNNLPVAGATVTFSVGGSGASFGTGSTLTVVTNAAGQATAAGLTPTAAGAVQINVTAAMQGQLASAAITQTNFVTAQAAAAAGSGSGAAGGGAAGGGSGASGGGAAGAGAGAGGGLSATTIGLVGAAVAGGAVAVTQTDLLGGEDGFVVISGRVFSTVQFGGNCTVPAGVGQAPQECYGPPVAGATIASTLDGNTTTTDGAGNFDLTTTIPLSSVRECRTYTLNISATGHPTLAVNVRGFSGNTTPGSQHRQFFSLSPGTPNSMGGGC